MSGITAFLRSREKDRMKKRILIIICTMALSLVLFGCGSKNEFDEEGNALISSDWHLREFTVNDSSTNVKEEGFLLRLLTVWSNPKFKCKDGTNCTFSYGKRALTGTVTEEDGEYTITFDEKVKTFKGTISGNTLTLTSGNGKLRFVFETNG